MARNGKIARLPSAIREELNIRLDNSEETASILQWLNQLPAAIEVVNTRYNGAPINEHNLSEWRTGGFQEWQKIDDLIDRSARLAEGERVKDVAAYARDRIDKAVDVVAISFAGMMTDWGGQNSPEFEANLKLHTNLSNQVLRLQKALHRRDESSMPMPRALPKLRTPGLEKAMAMATAAKVATVASAGKGGETTDPDKSVSMELISAETTSKDPTDDFEPTPALKAFMEMVSAHVSEVEKALAEQGDSDETSSRAVPAPISPSTKGESERTPAMEAFAEMMAADRAAAAAKREQKVEGARPEPRVEPVETPVETPVNGPASTPKLTVIPGGKLGVSPGLSPGLSSGLSSGLSQSKPQSKPASKPLSKGGPLGAPRSKNGFPSAEADDEGHRQVGQS